jgi:predicted lipoprotein
MIVAAGVALAACGKTKTPQVDADTARARAAQEQQEAHDRAVKDTFGTQVQAYDKAKALGADVNSKVEDNVGTVDQMK